MRPDRGATLLACALLLLVAACSKSATVKPPKIKGSEQIAPEYSYSDSEATKKRVQVRETLALAGQRFATGDLAEAEKQANKALKLDPTAADAYTLLGAIAARRGQTAQAGGHYRRAAELAPHHEAAVVHRDPAQHGQQRADHELGLGALRGQGADLIGIIDLDLDRVQDALLAEEKLLLLQRHEDEGAVVVGGARTEQAADEIGLLKSAEVAEGAVGPGRRIQGHRIADAQAHGVGEGRADQNAVAAIGSLAEAGAFLRA